jgi:hypothetical protein
MSQEQNQEMSQFDFDSDDNKTSTKTPSLKAIGGGIKDRSGKPFGAGLWLANENAEVCGWEKQCTEKCDFSCMEHLKGMIPHGIDTKKVDEEQNDIVIPGNVILNPRMLVIGRSPLLKLDQKSGYVVGEWVKGDGEKKTNTGDKMFACARRYFLIMVDEKNIPLHNVDQPIQLTARGYFQMEFDKQLMFFRTSMIRAYNESEKKCASNMNDAWHSMCVFAPVFKSEMRGPSPDKQSKACVATKFEIPNKTNWLTLCVGRSGEFAQKVFKTHNEHKDWWKKSIQSKKTVVACESDDDVVYIAEDEEKGIESF